MKTEINLYRNISKPFIVRTGAVIEVDGKFQEFPTEEEAWEFYYERKNGC